MLGERRILAPCKINLHLRILDRRPDGFHNLESIFQSLQLADELSFKSLKDRFACVVEMDGPVMVERNIVYDAVAEFRRFTGFDGGVQFRLRKRIPFGAGLGGGSSDAAAALLALDQLAATNCSAENLLAMAARIGSDVPFFLTGGTAYVTGRGDCVRPISGRLDYAVVLIYPGFQSDTKTAYQGLDVYREKGLPELAPSLTMAEAVRALAGPPAAWPFSNDFLAVLKGPPQPSKASASLVSYERLFEQLQAYGADFVGLSGSGSSCFGIFSDLAAAKRSAKALFCPQMAVHLTLPLARSGFRVLE